MAGFNINGSGSPYQKSNVAETRRKHRWLFTRLGILNPGDLVYLKTAKRPKFNFEEVTMHHDQEEAYFAGKQKWENMSLSWYDAQQDPNVSKKLYQWLQSVNPTLASGRRETCLASPSRYKTIGTLAMTGNCDTSLGEETWDLYGVWPLTCDWGDLDYSTNDIILITTVIRYDKAVRSR